MALLLQQPMAMELCVSRTMSQHHDGGLLRLPPRQPPHLMSQRRRGQKKGVVVAVLKSRNKPSSSDYNKSRRSQEEGRSNIKTGGEGIFGTSGRIGFTKENELFVGRVAMLGFASSLLGEAVTGKGILAQLNLETGVPIYKAEPLLLFFILFTLLGAIGALGGRGQFVDDATGIERAVIPPGKGFRSALGLNEGGPLFGFTKANELFVGRVAQLGIAFSLIGEIVTGKGALAQLNIETGVPVTEIEPLLLFSILFFFFAAINPGTGKFVTDEDTMNE